MQVNQKKSSVLSKNNITEYFLELLTKNKTLISSIIGGVMLVVVIVFALNMVSTNNNESATRALDSAITTINNLSMVSNESDRMKIYQEQINMLQSLVQSFPGTVAAERARLFLGKIFYNEAYRGGNQEGLTLALSFYSGLYETGKSSFYKAMALFGRAECYEQKQDFMHAYSDYELVTKEFSKEGLNAFALVGMARNKEMMSVSDPNALKMALDLYQKVAINYPKSGWSRFAKGKIYYYNDMAARKSTMPVINNNNNVIPLNGPPKIK
jgi:tetratricopeptide (TPR) repeat protein